MTVRVKLFAAARELAGAAEVPVEVAAGATVRDVERALLKQLPALEQIVAHARWAIDSEFVTGGRRAAEDAEIALIPPVSGG